MEAANKKTDCGGWQVEQRVGIFLDVRKAQKNRDQSLKWLLIFIQEKTFLETSVVVSLLSRLYFAKMPKKKGKRKEKD